MVFSGSHSSAENTKFKCVLDGGSDKTKLQQAFTNDFLLNMGHGSAVGEVDHAGERTYDTDMSEFLKFRYKKKYGKTGNYKTPECWILYIREDNFQPEVWIGFKSGNVQPIYRLYPDPAPEYK